MDKIAIIVQRYSLDVNGGAELHARMLAEHLKGNYEVEVLTSCAKDYITWENYYPEGVENINGILVHRFKVEERDKKVFHESSKYLYKNKKYSRQKIKWSNFFSLPFKKLRYERKDNHDEMFEIWMKELGPRCEGLIDYLEAHKEDYTTFIFFTYVYYLTYKGLQIPEIANKSILIPTAHDEITFHLEGYGNMFSRPRFIMYNTAAEKELVERTYIETKNIRSDIAGVGFDKPVITLNNNNVPAIDYRYIVYIGRIDLNKGCKELIQYFGNYKNKYSSDLKLIMIGNNFLEETDHHDDVVYTGYIDEQKKLWYLQNSQALVIPSRHESLSMVTLEAMSMGKPVLANKDSEVLKKHIENSNAGFLYNDRKSFSDQLNKILHLTKQEKENIATNGTSYVRQNYDWKSILDKFHKAIDYIKN